MIKYRTIMSEGTTAKYTVQSRPTDQYVGLTADLIGTSEPRRVYGIVDPLKMIQLLKEFVEEGPVVSEETLFDLTKNSRDQTVQVNVLGSKVTLNIEDLLQALKDEGITVS